MPDKTRLEQLQELLAADPDDPFLRYGLAMEYVGVGDDLTAARCFRELIEKSPGYVPSYLMAAQSLVRLNRDDEAKAVLRQGVTAAKQENNQHALGEIQELLERLEDL
jgi:thioredoxin-like negative regulator of GroEL